MKFNFRTGVTPLLQFLDTLCLLAFIWACTAIFCVVS